MKTRCFNAYDIRGRVPDELSADLARRIACAYAVELKARTVAVGYDIRLSSPAIADAVIEGLRLADVTVLNIGLCGTENIYHATDDKKLDGGIMITASHNPVDFNGLKMVRSGSRPVGVDSGLSAIKKRVEDDDWQLPECMGGEECQLDNWDSYINHLLSFIDLGALKPLKLVVNPGHGGAGLVIERLMKQLPFEFILMDFSPDGNFPQGVPNPLLPDNQKRTSEKVIECSADLGIAWDGDFDRCFLFDEKGHFVNGYYLVSLIARELLYKNSLAKIIYEPRLLWNTEQVIKDAGGTAVLSRTGHAFIKECMRENNAVYGGEISGHHYFRDFHYCDSGMVPWLLIAAMLCRLGQPLSSLIADYQKRFPASDEMNRRVNDAAAIIEKVEAHYAAHAEGIDYTDGLSMSFGDWRFNLRMSNTEPLLRLNLETSRNHSYLNERIDEVNGLLDTLDV